MAYTLITANRNYSSWSLRPWLLMRALDIPFEERFEGFARSDNHAAFRAFSPTGQVPVLIDGDRTIWDSMGITLYLAERHPGIWPAEEAARAWAMCAVAEMHGGFGALRNDCPMNVGVRIAPKPPSPGLSRQIARLGGSGPRGCRALAAPGSPARPFPRSMPFMRQSPFGCGPMGLTWAPRGPAG